MDKEQMTALLCVFLSIYLNDKQIADTYMYLAIVYLIRHIYDRYLSSKKGE